MGKIRGALSQYAAHSQKWIKLQQGTKDVEAGMFLRLLKLLGGREKTALDVGCGTGRYESMASSCYKRFSGIDAVEEFIAAAKKRGLKNCRFMVADANKGFPAGKYDVIFSCYAIHPAMLKLGNFLRHAQSHLAAGGAILFQCQGTRWFQKLGLNSGYSRKEIGAELAKAGFGFSIERVEHFQKGKPQELFDFVLSTETGYAAKKKGLLQKLMRKIRLDGGFLESAYLVVAERKRRSAKAAF